jgi:hypothetical protein
MALITVNVHKFTRCDFLKDILDKFLKVGNLGWRRDTPVFDRKT